MTKYPNSECQEHRDVKTDRPVCIICLGQEIERLRELAQASLDAREKEARAAMSFENAQMNFHRFDAEQRAHEQAMIEASAADKALREHLTPPNAKAVGLDAAGGQSHTSGGFGGTVTTGENDGMAKDLPGFRDRDGRQL